MSSKIVQSSGNTEFSRNLDHSDNNDPSDDIVSEKVKKNIYFAICK